MSKVVQPTATVADGFEPADNARECQANKCQANKQWDVSAWAAGERPKTAFYAGRIEGKFAESLGVIPQDVWFVPFEDTPEVAVGVWSLDWEWLGSRVTVRRLSRHS